ncbi:MAG: cobalamin biosynthesis protein [Syntrophomonadaceae bacterium]|nr:cobalamin biosynthesis protein [Syntrophomonadaceae bacterium]MDH7497915.1 cobalamin biosynthesis protein [Syntrophomonadaceae bacterium]
MATAEREVVILSLEGPGMTVGQSLARRLPGRLVRAPRPGPGVGELVRQHFGCCRGMVLVMASGIAVRALSGLLHSKHEDPGVVVVDRAGRYAVSLVGGHEGGANQLACDVADILGAEPVITTASESEKHVAVGLGYRCHASAADLEAAVREGLARCDLRPEQVRFLATAGCKRAQGLLYQVGASLGALVRHLPHQWLALKEGVSPDSAAAMRHLGVKGVSEQCALLSLNNARILLPRTRLGPVTVAVAAEPSPWSDWGRGEKRT